MAKDQGHWSEVDLCKKKCKLHCKFHLDKLPSFIYMTNLIPFPFKQSICSVCHCALLCYKVTLM